MTAASSLVAIGPLVHHIEMWDPHQSPTNHEIDYIDIASINRESKTIEAINRVLSHEAPSRARQLVQAGDVLVSTVRPNLNAVAQVPSQLSGATASTGFTVLRPDPSKLCGRYLYHWVRSNSFIRQMVARATGASYPAVTDQVVKESKIPLTPLQDQQHIATILDKADAIWRKRQEAIALSEEFLRSAFLEMFGDPVTNPKEWPIAMLEEVADVASGAMKGRKFNGQSTVKMPYLRVANVQDGFLDLSEVKEIEVLSSDVESYRLQAGDMLMTEGGDPDKLGRGAVWKGEIETCLHQNHIFRVRANSHYLVPEFLSALAGSARGKRYFLRAAKQTTGIATINMTQLRKFPILLPPVDLQHQYARTTDKVRSLNVKLGRAKETQDDLFNSLVQRAFRGEL